MEWFYSLGSAKVEYKCANLESFNQSLNSLRRSQVRGTARDDMGVVASQGCIVGTRENRQLGVAHAHN